MRLMSDVREALWGVVQARGQRPRLRLRRLRAPSTSSGCASGASNPELEELARCRVRVSFRTARAIVIVGGGVGGTSIAYHLAELGERDVAAARPRRADERLDVPLRGARRPAARVSVSLTRMMMYSVELYRRCAASPSYDPGWIECGGIRLACTPEREQEIRRQVAWAKTFGLPLELISPDEARELLPADGHRRRARRVVPADRRLPRSLAADLRARRRRARAAACRSSRTRA